MKSMEIAWNQLKDWKIPSEFFEIFPDNPRLFSLPDTIRLEGFNDFNGSLKNQPDIVGINIKFETLEDDVYKENNLIDLDEEKIQKIKNDHSDLIDRMKVNGLERQVYYSELKETKNKFPKVFSQAKPKKKKRDKKANRKKSSKKSQSELNKLGVEEFQQHYKERMSTLAYI